MLLHRSTHRLGLLFHRNPLFSGTINRFSTVLPHILSARRFPQRRPRPKEESSEAEKSPPKRWEFEISWSSKGHRETKSDANSASEGNENRGNKGDGDDPRKQLMEKMKRWLAISLFAYGILFILSPKGQGAAAVTADKISWSEFINELLPTGQVYRNIILP